MKKKNIIIIIIVGLIIAAGVVAALLLTKKEEPTPKPENTTPTVEKVIVTFDSNGGEAVEKLEIDKGAQVLLPSTTRDGYLFDGWYLNEEKISSTYVYNENITVVAKWEKIKEEVKTFKVSYDTKGGNKINPTTLACGKTLTLPANPKKDGYTFAGWEDKNGKSITNGAKFTCENVTLYAKWNKNEVYSCPDGYTLDGKKCTMAKDPTMICPTGTREDGDKCIKLNEYTQGTRTCGTKIVNMGGGHTPSVQGVKVEAGTTFCYYGEVNDDKDTCTSRGRKWCTSLNKCFIDMDQNYQTECPSDYQYYTSNQLQEKFGAHNNGGCYKKYNKVAQCDTANGYTVSGNKCVKTIDATIN